MISVLMPVYNTKAEMLIESIKSCLFQSINDYEIILVDNGSTDRQTLETIKQFSNNKKINIFNCPRQQGKNNISLALNLGLSRCKNDLVARMDSDDIMLYDRLEKQVNCMNKNKNIDILGAQMKVFPEGYTTNHPKIITNDIALNSSWFINHPTIVYRKNRIIELGGYSDAPEHGAEDYKLWMTSIRCGLKICNMPDIVLHYRSHGENLTRKREKHKSYYESIENEKNKLREHLK
jgi:glycosyltransferase involved in cell wall biosynthesis